LRQVEGRLGPGESAIELDRLQEIEPPAAESDERFPALVNIFVPESGGKVLVEVARPWKPMERKIDLRVCHGLAGAIGTEEVVFMSMIEDRMLGDALAAALFGNTRSANLSENRCTAVH
jgi:hypothetical protein